MSPNCDSEIVIFSESSKLRNEGKELYKEGKIFEALIKFDESLSKAQTNCDLALAYAYRSRVNFKCNLFALCLDNIRRALDKAKECHYHKQSMSNLSTQLQKLEEKCLKMIKAEQQQDYVKPPFIIDGLELTSDPVNGCHIVITRDLRSGEIVNMMPPMFASLNLNLTDDDCLDDCLLDYEEKVLPQSSAYRELLLKPEIVRAIDECGFISPSTVQQECIPQVIYGRDLLCEAKSGTGKTAVFVISTLHQLDMIDDQVHALVICHTRELALQIGKEFERLGKYMSNVKIAVFFGGMPIQKDEHILLTATPHIVVGTPGRVLSLVRSKQLNLKHLRHFVLDECDKMLEQLEMRRDVQEIFCSAPNDKQVMMFTATLSKEIRPICKKFMKNPMEVFVDDESKLSFHGLQHHYLSLKEHQKNMKLFEILDLLDFNQVVIFVKTVHRCEVLASLLAEHNFPAVAIHRGMSQAECLFKYQQFQDFEKRILVATNLFGRGIKNNRVNIVFNYDVPEDTDTYLHRVARAGHFNSKGLAITFVADERGAEILNNVQDRFVISISELPDEIDFSYYTGQKN